MKNIEEIQAQFQKLVKMLGLSIPQSSSSVNISSLPKGKYIAKWEIFGKRSILTFSLENNKLDLSSY